MSEILRDPIWTFVSVIVAAIFGVISIVLFIKQRRSKKLSYQVLTNTSLLSVASQIKQRVRITLDDKPVEDVSLVEIEIANSGNVPIASGDFEEPITINFGAEAEVLPTPTISSSKPSTLKPALTYKSADITINPVLLNQGDSFIIKALVSRFQKLVIDGRIVGVRDIRMTAQGESPLFLKITVLAFVVSYTLQLLILLAIPPKSPIFPSALLAFLFIGLVTIGLMVASFVRRMRGRRRRLQE
jgi:hypothetical protein